MMKKQFVRVSGTWEKNGTFIPAAVLWQNGVQYKIEKIIQRCPAASLDGSGVGMRYTCLFSHGQRRYLYFDENRWFIEK